MANLAAVLGAHRVLVTVKGGVAYAEGATAPFGVEVRDLDNGDQPFSLSEIEAQATRAAAIKELVDLVPTIESTMADGCRALDALSA